MKRKLSRALTAAAVMAALAFLGSQTANAYFYTCLYPPKGVGSCPAGNQKADNNVCITCRVSGATGACVSWYFFDGCADHVCNGACGGAGGTPCTYTISDGC